VLGIHISRSRLTHHDCFLRSMLIRALIVTRSWERMRRSMSDRDRPGIGTPGRRLRSHAKRQLVLSRRLGLRKLSPWLDEIEQTSDWMTSTPS